MTLKRLYDKELDDFIKEDHEFTMRRREQSRMDVALMWEATNSKRLSKKTDT